MTKNLQNSKIYKIFPTQDHEEGDIYIGSTTKKYLCQRMGSHNYAYKKWKEGAGTKTMLYDLVEKYGFYNLQIVLLESFPCKSIDELRAKEAEYINTFGCVNKNIPGRSHYQYYQEKKQDEEFKKKDCERSKKKYIQRLEKNPEYNKEYYEKNKERLKENQKRYNVKKQQNLLESE